eukprot:scaffold32973_cov31-Tisochrysis_lutea.AAC.8
MRRETAGGGYGRFLWRDAGWAKCTKNLQKCKARKDRCRASYANNRYVRSGASSGQLSLRRQPPLTRWECIEATVAAICSPSTPALGPRSKTLSDRNRLEPAWLLDAPQFTLMKHHVF